MGLEKKLKEAEEKLCSTLEGKAPAREVAIVEARQKLVVDFKQSKGYTLATQDFEVSYDKGIEEIFYNIWRKQREVC